MKFLLFQNNFFEKTPQNRHNILYSRKNNWLLPPPSLSCPRLKGNAHENGLNLNTEVNTMEVHHHAHHGHEKKNWKNYFWEFFMIFFAVFCGSLAELELEHYIEHQREKKYAKSLFEDLVNDVEDLKYDIDGWRKANRRADTLIAELEKNAVDRNHKLLYKCVSLVNFNNTFLYHDRTIQQLKSAGNFRIMREKAVTDSLVEYDAWIAKTVVNIEDIYGMVLNPEMHNLENQLFNTKYFGIARNEKKLDSVYLLAPQKIKMIHDKPDIAFQFYNKVHNYKSLTQARINYLSATLRRATNLIAILKERYHLNESVK